MDLDELRAFIAVIDTGSFAGASKSLNFARATLRRRVDELEARSGVQLLERSTDGARATLAGAMLAEKGRAILQDTRLLFDAVRALEQRDELITIALPAGVPIELERAAHQTLRRAAPSLRWRVRHTAGEFDPASKALAVVHIDDDPVDVGEHWQHTFIGPIQLGLVASDAYIGERGAPTQIDALHDHPILVWEYRKRDEVELPLRCPGAPALPIHPTFVSPSLEMIRECVQNDEGIAFVGVSNLRFLFGDSTRVIRVLEREIGATTNLWISSRKDIASPTVRAFVDAITRFTRSAIHVWE